MTLETELEDFKKRIREIYKDNTTNFIYLRLSTIDNTLKSENERIKDTLDKLQADFNKLLEIYPTLKENGFNEENVLVMFIPNTYEFYWNSSPTDFFEKMLKQYNKFWNSERKQKAAALNLSPIQVSILASIVDAEALYDKEMPTIAGLYLNRLNRGILLQADPTVIFANDDFTIKRVLNSHLASNSKYNTYKYGGLPPGPIMMPSIKAIDAVLNKENNNYIYMCAKEDFSGYHAFAETREQHEINANKYRAAMNKRNIYK